MVRREVLKNGFLAAYFFSAGTVSLSALAKSASDTPRDVGGASIKLAHALRLIGSKRCVEAAQLLEASGKSGGNISLHLRSAGINGTHADIIANALLSLSQEEASSLRSFSLSFNLEIGDKGALAIARSFPLTLRELGLVGCGIGDRGGKALLQRARQASRLRMLCIEDNQFSQKVTEQFKELAQTNQNLLVVV
jgi:hypothetical protein